MQREQKWVHARELKKAMGVVNNSHTTKFYLSLIRRRRTLYGMEYCLSDYYEYTAEQDRHRAELEAMRERVLKHLNTEENAV